MDSLNEAQVELDNIKAQLDRIISNLKNATSLVDRNSTEISSTEISLTELHNLSIPEKLEKLGLQRFEVDGGGNCQFRAVSHQLFKSDEYHRRIREDACTQLLENPNYYKQFFIEEDHTTDYDTYIQKMTEDREWGDNLTLKAIGDFYDCNIRVITNTYITTITTRTSKQPRTITLIYKRNENTGNHHYDSVEPIPRFDGVEEHTDENELGESEYLDLSVGDAVGDNASITYGGVEAPNPRSAQEPSWAPKKPMPPLQKIDNRDKSSIIPLLGVQDNGDNNITTRDRFDIQNKDEREIFIKNSGGTSKDTSKKTAKNKKSKNTTPKRLTLNKYSNKKKSLDIISHSCYEGKQSICPNNAIHPIISYNEPKYETHVIRMPEKKIIGEVDSELDTSPNEFSEEYKKYLDTFTNVDIKYNIGKNIKNEGTRDSLGGMPKDLSFEK